MHRIDLVAFWLRSGMSRWAADWLVPRICLVNSQGTKKFWKEWPIPCLYGRSYFWFSCHCEHVRSAVHRSLWASLLPAWNWDDWYGWPVFRLCENETSEGSAKVNYIGRELDVKQASGVDAGLFTCDCSLFDKFATLAKERAYFVLADAMNMYLQVGVWQCACCSQDWE